MEPATISPIRTAIAAAPEPATHFSRRDITQQNARWVPMCGSVPPAGLLQHPASVLALIVARAQHIVSLADPVAGREGGGPGGRRPGWAGEPRRRRAGRRL